jgi:bacterioferritin-associated ferredoxin
VVGLRLCQAVGELCQRKPGTGPPPREQVREPPFCSFRWPRAGHRVAAQIGVLGAFAAPHRRTPNRWRVVERALAGYRPSRSGGAASALGSRSRAGGTRSPSPTWHLAVGRARFTPGGLGRAVTGPAATTLLCAGPPGLRNGRGVWARCGCCGRQRRSCLEASRDRSRYVPAC